MKNPFGTVLIVYVGRAAKVILDNSKLKEIEENYQQCENDGASDYQIDDSKKAMASMGAILGDPDRIQALAYLKIRTKGWWSIISVLKPA